MEDGDGSTSSVSVSHGTDSIEAETADTLAALQMEAERRNACLDNGFASRQLGITNRIESSLSRQVPNILDIGAGIEVGVAATKTFLGQLAFFISAHWTGNLVLLVTINVFFIASLISSLLKTELDI